MGAIILTNIYVTLVIALTKQVYATKFLSRGFLHQDPPYVKQTGLSWDECLSECQRRSSCKSVIFRRHTQSCRLYDRLSSGISGEPNPGTVYGLPAWRNTRVNANTACNQHECNDVDCGPIPAVNNTFFVDRNTTFGSNVTYMCNSGYIHNDGSDITFCTQHGQWSPVTIACTLIDCGPIPAVNKSKSTEHNTTVGSNVTYMCNSGYIHNDGSGISFCTQHGQWSPVTIACTLIDCGPIPAVNNAKSTEHNTTVGSNVTYMCNSGYIHNDGSDITFCTQHGQWSPVTIACTPVDCGPIPAVHNAYSTEHNTTFGSNVTYICNSGYRHNNGSDVTFCSQHGQWSPVTIACTLIDCGPIPAVNNAFAVDYKTTFGSYVTYMCSSGFIHNDGSDVTFCSQHGQWSPVTLACTPVDCGQPNVTSRVVTGSGSTFYGTTRTIRCADGYESDVSGVSDSALSCLSNGSWSETEFSCELNLTGFGDFGNFRSDSVLVQSEIVYQIYGDANFTGMTLYDCVEKCRTVSNYCIAINYNTEKSMCTLADRFLQILLQTANGWDILYKKVGVYFTNGPNGWYTLEYQSAVDHCVQRGSAIAQRSDIESAFSKGLNVDQCGWIEEDYAVIMLHHPVAGVYSRTGINLCTWSNTWGVYCKSSSLPPL